MSKAEDYVGIDNDINGGMTSVGKIIRDAWVFEIIPETETCKGWSFARIEQLLHKVNDEWDKYGVLASDLPEDLRERYQRIQSEAFLKAKEAGWSGEYETDDEGSG